MQRESVGIGRELLTAEEAAQILGIGRTKAFAMMAARELPVVRIGRLTRVPREGLASWIRDHTVVTSDDDAA